MNNQYQQNHPNYYNQQPGQNISNAEYARLRDEQPPLPVIIDDGSIINGQPIVPGQRPGYGQGYGQGPIIQQHGQAQGQGFNNYNQGYLPNNQGFNNQNQGFNVHTFTPLIKCLCITIIVQNIIYTIFDIITFGLSINFIWFFMIFQIVRFSIFLCSINDGIVSQAQFDTVKKTFICTFVFYIVYFIISLILLIVVIKNQNPDYDLTELIIIDVISSVIFLLPRSIALCYVNSKSKVPRPQNIMYVNQ